jgi:hypothetical protein
MVALFGLLLLGWYLTSVLSTSMSFEEAKWRQDHSARKAMVDDLISSRRLVGLRREEVTGLLGQPEDVWSKGGEYVYYLGPEPGGKYVPSIDSEWLAVAFEHEVVSRVSVKRD